MSSVSEPIPQGARLILQFISGFESQGRYYEVFGNPEAELSKPITKMTLDEVLERQVAWGKRWGSSAAGAYQFIRSTLFGLKAQLGLTGTEVFAPALQDRLGYELLKTRGYAQFKDGKLSTVNFAKKLGQEFASMPMLAKTQGAHRVVARGETYYAGDKLNRALVSPGKVEELLAQVLAAKD